MAWENVDIELKRALIDIRKTVGLKRQAQFSADYEKLMDLLSGKGANPFEIFDGTIYDLLNSISPNFKEGGQWEIGDPSESRYFYRIETLGSFLGKHRSFIYRDVRAAGKIILAPEASDEDNIFSAICTDYIDNGKGWQELSRLTSAYFSHRNISWWTNHYIFEDEGQFPATFEGSDLTQENRWLLEFAFKVGVTSDWLSSNMLFMQLDSTKMCSLDIRVPSIIDAILQPIFSPQQLAPPPAQCWGRAFDLNKDIKPFYREYVLKNISVDAIRYFPVKVDESTFDLINAGARLESPMVEALIQNI